MRDGARLLQVHRDLLERFRRSMNLVGPGPIAPHYADADAALDGLEPVGRWADLGTGAGFPGIVLAARYPAVEVDLVDSRQKRCVFLEQVLAEAGDPPGVRVVQARIEDLPGAIYDGITARALAPPDEVARHAARLLRPGGRALLLVGADAEVAPREDLVVVRRAAYDVDGRPRAVIELAHR